MSSKLKDEILETLWVLREKGLRGYADVLGHIGDHQASEVMRNMEKSDLIVISDDEIEFTVKGEKLARDVTRRHRLAERLFHDVLEIGMKESEAAACEIEHILSPLATDKVCSFLGHPPTCPHGKAIPRGDCCLKYSPEVKPLVMKLRELDAGTWGRIVFIVPSEDTRLERLASMGIVAGAMIKLKRKRPSIVLEIDETTLAVDTLIAEEIYVKQA